MRRVLMTIIVFVFAGLASQARELTVATGDYPPLTDSTSDTGGTVNALVRQMAEDAGFTVDFLYMPWIRALELARVGDYAASSFWYHDADREADFIHVGPVVEDRLVMFRLRDTDVPEWQDLSDLSDFRFGAVTGYTITSEFWELSEAGTITVEIAPSDVANFRKLLAGRIDLYPMSLDSGYELIANSLTDEERARITIVEQPLSVQRGYLLVSRSIEDATRIAGALQTQLDRIRGVENVQANAMIEPVD